jgi:hypothetical protein
MLPDSLLRFNGFGMVKYLEWKNSVIVSAKGCYAFDDVINSEYSKQAYEIGKSL